MQWQFDDGGRSAAGYKGSTGDCAVRAAAIATGLPYQHVYDAINALGSRERTGKRQRGKSSARTGVYSATMRKYMASLGWQWTPTMHIGSGCTVRLCTDELPTGRIVARVSKHYVAIVDGVIHDTHNPSARGTTIYPPGYLGNIPKGARWLENGNGWAYSPERCVYGYWSRA